jgi:hypothetical protein
MVRWDDAAVDEERSRQQLELVTASTALSPGAKRARKARAGGKSASEDEGSGSDSSSSSASGDEVSPEPANIYAARSEAFDLQMEPKYGTTVTVRMAFDIFPSSLSDAPPPPPQVTNGTGGRQVTTEYRIVRTTGEVDAFEELAGSAGQPKETKKTVQENILTDFSFENFTKKKLLEYLYPGDFATNFEVFRVEFESTFSRAKPPTKGEVWRFIGMIIGATQFTQRGRELFRQTSYAGLRGHPNYARFMNEVRFEQFKKVFHFLFADVTRKNSDAWWPIRGGVDGYNANRKNKVRRTRVICVDEAMSAYQPRASKTDGLPHLSRSSSASRGHLEQSLRPPPMGHMELCSGSKFRKERRK